MNGIVSHSGNSLQFYSLIFCDPCYGEMLGIVFEQEWRVAVLRIKDLPNIQFGFNFWRGDHFENGLRESIKKCRGLFECVDSLAIQESSLSLHYACRHRNGVMGEGFYIATAAHEQQGDLLIVYFEDGAIAALKIDEILNKDIQSSFFIEGNLDEIFEKWYEQFACE